MLNARYFLPKNSGITDQQWLQMVNNQYALLLLKYIHVKAAITSVSFLYDFQITDRS